MLSLPSTDTENVYQISFPSVTESGLRGDEGMRLGHGGRSLGVQG